MKERVRTVLLHRTNPNHSERLRFRMAKSNVSQSVYSILFENMCALGGGSYRGVLPAFHDKNHNLVEPVCLFDSPATLSTVGIPFFEMSADAVRRCCSVSERGRRHAR
jgi:hypothetical protein